MAAAYSDSLARKFGRLNRDKFREFAPELSDLEISSSNSAVKDWGVEGHAGGMLAAGIGGSITGHGADVMIIDDPIKNAKEAMSETIRENVWNEWESTLSTRLHAGASVVVVMTRWHEDDLIGKLLKTGGRKWIRLQAVKSVNGRTAEVVIDKTDVALGNVDNIQQATKTEFNAHNSSRSNPHGVTASQVGAYTAVETDSKVSSAQNAVQTNLNTHVNNKANPHATTKSHVGLGNVDNAQQATKVRL